MFTEGRTVGMKVGPKETIFSLYELKSSGKIESSAALRPEIEVALVIASTSRVETHEPSFILVNKWTVCWSSRPTLQDYTPIFTQENCIFPALRIDDRPNLFLSTCALKTCFNTEGSRGFTHDGRRCLVGKEKVREHRLFSPPFSSGKTFWRKEDTPMKL